MLKYSARYAQDAIEFELRNLHINGWDGKVMTNG